MYVTTEAVESFVEEHYGDQIARSWIADLYRFMRSDVSQKSTNLLP
jgi:demethoxyubiquinone hydroxylase (CLK1/Coq7/Cat5 family)